MPSTTFRDPIYRRRRFAPEVIEQCVRWYISYKLSYRDLVALMADQGVKLTHTTIMRWVLRYVPEYEARWARFARPVGSSWRMDETAIRIMGKHHWLYRAVDRQAKTVSSMLCRNASMVSAQAFLRCATATPGVDCPATINLDGSASSGRAIRLLSEADERWRRVAVRRNRYVNNVVEQDHRAIKQRCAPMLGFKSFATATVTLAGVELAHRIRKGQYWLDPERVGEVNGSEPLKTLWAQALTPGVSPTPNLRLCPPMHQNSNSSRLARSACRRSILTRQFPKKIFAGKGLYMLLMPNGGRYWRYKYHYRGREKLISLGIYPEVTLARARERHAIAREMLRVGVDPVLAETRSPSESCTREYLGLLGDRVASESMWNGTHSRSCGIPALNGPRTGPTASKPWAKAQIRTKLASTLASGRPCRRRSLRWVSNLLKRRASVRSIRALRWERWMQTYLRGGSDPFSSP